MSDPSAILTFLVDESAKFHNALAAAVKAWADSGSVPKELIPTPKKTKQKRAKSLIPRKPSGYTLFVTEHIANLRSEGIMSSKEKGKDYMSLAGAKWKTMSDEAKAVFNAKAAAAAPAVASGGAGVLALPPSGAGGSGDGGEKKKKKKKKRDHEGSDEHKKHKKHKKHHSDSD